MGGSAATRNGKQVPRRRNGVPAGDGCAWEVQAAVSAMWHSDPTDQIRFERNELLSLVSDEREIAGRPGILTVTAGRLAKDAGRAGDENGKAEIHSQQLNVERENSYSSFLRRSKGTDSQG